jgi:hypothetical protein
MQDAHIATRARCYSHHALLQSPCTCHVLCCNHPQVTGLLQHILTGMMMETLADEVSRLGSPKSSRQGWNSANSMYAAAASACSMYRKRTGLAGTCVGSGHAATAALTKGPLQMPSMLCGCNSGHGYAQQSLPCNQHLLQHLPGPGQAHSCAVLDAHPRHRPSGHGCTKHMQRRREAMPCQHFKCRPSW